ncbi:MAG: putative 4-hydroxybenzoate polyprenyltransferase [Bacteroidia bacterium]|nr:putative 4-hydroxybenzoate polyprenyltransferase [Bacteroidia bacterium]
MALFQHLKNWFSLIRFSHTVFALPFALIGFFLALREGERFTLSRLLWVILCMVSARTAAMAFNRYADHRFDALNERTKNREIPKGIIRPEGALWLTILSSLLFVCSAFMLNSLCGYLSPVALLVILGYSYTKRFTPLCHIILGVGLSLAPVGAYLAVKGTFHWLPVLFGLVVLFWVSGFDILYALPDADFDRSQGLFSIPSIIGIKRAMAMSKILHGLAFLFLCIIGYFFSWGFLYYIGALIFSILMFYQHRLVKPDDFSRINLAFGTLNGWASVIFGALVIGDILLRL